MTEIISRVETAGHSSLVSQPSTLESEHVTIIAPAPGWRALNIREMWNYRELLFFLIWRDVKVRYKQTVLGVAWAVIQPLMYMVVFVVVFFRIAHAPSEGLPYPLFAFCGLVLWTFFATAITQAGNSVIGSEALITKVYFPRLAIPFAAVGAAMFDFAVTFVVLIVFILSYAIFSVEATSIAFTWQLVLVPVIFFVTVLAALGVGILLAALNVSFRDFKYTIPFLVQLWLFATPAIYLGIEHDRIGDRGSIQGTRIHGNQVSRPHDARVREIPKPTVEHSAQGVVPDWIQNLLKFNPMTGLIRSFRSAMLGQPMPWTHFAYSTVIVMVVFLASCLYFHRVEDHFADII